MNKNILYRGVSRKQYESDSGLKAKKQGKFERTMKLDEGFTHDSGFILDSHETNALITHNLDSDIFPSSGISTSTVYDVAKG